MRNLPLVLVLIAAPVVVCMIGIYMILKNAPIPLPAYSHTVRQGDALYDIVQASGSEVTTTWRTDGEIEVTADGDELVTTSYDLDSLGNTLNLVGKMLLPQRAQRIISTIYEAYLPLRLITVAAGEFFYRVLPLELTLVANAE